MLWVPLLGVEGLWDWDLVPLLTCAMLPLVIGIVSLGGIHKVARVFFNVSLLARVFMARLATGPVCVDFGLLAFAALPTSFTLHLFTNLFALLFLANC